MRSLLLPFRKDLHNEKLLLTDGPIAAIDGQGGQAIAMPGPARLLQWDLLFCLHAIFPLALFSLAVPGTAAAGWHVRMLRDVTKE